MVPQGNVNANNLVQTTVQYPAFRGTVNTILAATNQKQSINIVNVETKQINRNDCTDITSAGSTNNSTSSVTKMRCD